MLPALSFGNAFAERARCAGVPFDRHQVGSATAIFLPDMPRDNANRAYDVDAREMDVVVHLITLARRRGVVPRLEIATETLGADARRALDAGGLRRLWDVVALAVDLAAPPVASGTVPIRVAARSEAQDFADLAIAAFETAAADRAAWTTTFRGFVDSGLAKCFIAEHCGVPAALGILWMVGDAACIDGSATLRAHRSHGCQNALLAHRLEVARDLGARVAVSRTTPDSPSHRNLLRHGFAPWRTLEVWGEA